MLYYGFAIYSSSVSLKYCLFQWFWKFGLKKSYLHNEFLFPDIVRKLAGSCGEWQVDLFFFVFVWRSSDFDRKKHLNFGEDFFCISWKSPVFSQKNRFNLIQGWWKFGSSSFTDVSSFQKSPPCKILATLLLKRVENCNWAILWE